MTIIDSQFYIIDSLSLDISFEGNANLVIVWLYWLKLAQILMSTSDELNLAQGR